MESIEFYVKEEKPNGLRNIGKVFRFLEVFLLIVFVSWASTRVPFAIEFVVVFMRKLAGFVGRPLFVFLLSNLIIVAVIAKSSKEKTEGSNADVELYKEFIGKNENDLKLLREEEVPVKMKEEEIVYEDKKVIISELPPVVSCQNGDAELPEADDNLKVYQRSKSNLLERRSSVKEEVIKLRRSETMKFMKNDDKTISERLYSEEEMSNEEFRRTIDAFIAKQLTFRRYESLAVVVHEQT